MPCRPVPQDEINHANPAEQSISIPRPLLDSSLSRVRRKMHVFWFGNNAANMIERRLRQSVVGLAVREAKRGMHRQTGVLQHYLWIY